jgi:hypothetical protein
MDQAKLKARLRRIEERHEGFWADDGHVKDECDICRLIDGIRHLMQQELLPRIRELTIKPIKCAENWMSLKTATFLRNRQAGRFSNESANLLPIMSLAIFV